MKLPDYLDPMTLSLVCTVLLASLFPARGNLVELFQGLTTAAIALLFFMHGAKLSREAIIAGSAHWRLHLWIMGSTFVMFPLLGLLFSWWRPVPMSQEMYDGFLYLTILPATVQSSIAFTSLAGGNVAAAVCSASASSLLGVFISPLLVSLVMHVHGAGGNIHQLGSIMLQLLAPFVAGHLMRPWIAGWLGRHKNIVGKTDRASILLVVYSAFSEAVTHGIWRRVSPGSLVLILVSCLGFLAVIMVMNVWCARRLGFNRADEITILFCGSKKSLANGIPMANILFPAASVGVIVLPLMIFHQVQLMLCAVLARRYKNKAQQALPAAGKHPV